MPRSRSPTSSSPRHKQRWSRAESRDRSHDRGRSHSDSTRKSRDRERSHSDSMRKSRDRERSHSDSRTRSHDSDDTHDLKERSSFRSSGWGPRLDSQKGGKDMKERRRSESTSLDGDRRKTLSQSSSVAKDLGRKRRQSRPSSSSSSSSESSDSSSERRRRKKSKRKKKRAKSRSSSNSSSDDSRTGSKEKVKKKTKDVETSSSESSSDSSPERKRTKKKQKKERKKKKKAEKKRRKKEKKQRKKEKRRLSEIEQSGFRIVMPGPTLLPAASADENKDDSAKARSLCPMTKEEWEKQQSVVRRVFDPETGRNRLVKGDGEIIEEIVSKERHKQINQQATQGDGLSFMRGLGLNK